MKRKEEIEKAANKYVNEMVTSFPATIKVSFIKGAEWSDANPVHYDGKAYLYVLHKGVEQGKKEMLDEVCEWLKENGTLYWWDEEDDDGINDLRKAMEKRL